MHKNFESVYFFAMEKRIVKLNYIKKRIVSLFVISKIIAIHYFEFNETFSAETEIHSFWEFVYVDKGTIVTRVGEREYLLSQGEYIFYKPKDSHSLRSDQGTSPNVFIIVFVCHSSAMRLFQNRRGALPAPLRKYIAEIISEARQTYQLPFNDPYMVELLSMENEVPGGQQLIQINLEQLLIHLYRAVSTGCEAPAADQLISGILSDNELVNRMLQYIQANLYQNVTPASVCAHSGYSNSYISTLFHRTCGCSIVTFIQRKKIDEAKDLIRKGNLNFAEISERLHFSNQHYFSRVFRQITGMSPTEYRKSVQL